MQNIEISDVIIKMTALKSLTHNVPGIECTGVILQIFSPSALNNGSIILIKEYNP